MSFNGTGPHNQANGNGLPSVNSASASDDRLEAIAKHIETLTATATLQVGAELAKARAIFRYRRDEGGFAGWVETRLHYTRQTAYNLLHVHEQFGGREVSKCLDALGRSVLFLISAPGTPEEVRDEIIERGKAGESISVAEVKESIDIAKGRRRPPVPAADSDVSLKELFYADKLGDDTMAKIKDTSLDSSAEKNELVILNRGAEPGTLTSIVQQLVDDAAVGKAVSAVAAAAPFVRRREERRKLHDDVGAGELERLQARIDELGDEKRQLEIRIAALESENVELKAKNIELEKRVAAEQKLRGEIFEHLHLVRGSTGTLPRTAAVETLIRQINQVLDLVEAPPPSSPDDPKAPVAADGAIHNSNSPNNTSKPSLPKNKKTNRITLGDAITEVFDDFADLAEGCRRQVDNAPENLSQSQRIQTLEDAANTLEELESPDVAPELADIQIDAPKVRKPGSRAAARDDAVALLDACAEVLGAIDDSDPRYGKAVHLRDVLEDASGRAQECEFS